MVPGGVTACSITLNCILSSFMLSYAGLSCVELNIPAIDLLAELIGIIDPAMLSRVVLTDVKVDTPVGDSFIEMAFLTSA
jgi:hypothetical protein